MNHGTHTHTHKQTQTHKHTSTLEKGKERTIPVEML
jgi:hypothetical protein